MSCGRLPTLRPGAGLHAGQPRLPAVVSAAHSAGRLRAGLARRHRHARATASAPAAANRSPCCSSAASATIPIASRWIGSCSRCCRWFWRAQPDARLVVAGSDPPPAPHLCGLFGQPGDARLRRGCARAAGRYAVFVCPILSGSGVRVKLLEAFAAGIPGGFHHDRRRRSGARATANSARWRTTRRLSPSACWRFSRIPNRRGGNGRAGARRGRSQWDMAAITAAWWKSTATGARETRGAEASEGGECLAE